MLTLAAASVLSVVAGAALAQEGRRTNETTAGLSPSLVGTQISVGQGTYTVPAVPVASQGPYALTGPRSTSTQQGRWIDAGQGRVFLPAGQ
jgi:hypothetical protein